MTIKKGVGASGICDKVEFHNLNITDEGNTTLIYQNGASGCIKEIEAVSYTHLRAHETDSYLVCRLLLEKKKRKKDKKKKKKNYKKHVLTR